jgi:dienelactone hydrolase
VECAAKPEQSYALYLPSNYTAEKKWPIIYAYDPGAVGSRPLALAREAAEKHGYILAGSNNSRNGPLERGTEAAQAMWEDTHARFSIDDRRVYLTGFSGGSRFAVAIAMMCGTCAAGVIAHGAGFLPDLAPDKDKVKFSYYATIGDRDFNYPEMIALEEQLDKLGLPNRLRRFPGPHQWAPAEVWHEAIAWMELRAMREGRRPRDDAFIAQQAQRARDRVEQLGNSGDAYSAWLDARKLPQHFEGLADTAALQATAKELDGAAAVRAGRSREYAAIRLQQNLFGPVMELLDQLGTAADFGTVELNLKTRVRQLRKGAEDKKEKHPEAYQRALSQASASIFESGMTFLWEKNYARAAAFFELFTEIQPEAPGPYLRLAQAHAQAGSKKKAIRALERAVANGLPVARLQESPELESLRGEKDFQKLIAGSKP